jgi:o-succinylbenzoate synthase
MMSLTAFDLPLITPIRVRGSEVCSRTGYRLRLIDSLGHIGIGECSPLPGLHRETLAQSHAQLKEVCARELNLDEVFKASGKYSIRDSDSDAAKGLVFCLDRPYLGLLDWTDEFLPSVAFAVEQALLNLYLSQNPGALQTLFQVGPSGFSTAVNALLIPNEMTLQDPAKAAADLLTEKFRSVKVKVGRFSVAQESDFVSRLCSHLAGQCKIRLDGNQLFTESQFNDFVLALRTSMPSSRLSEEIEYFEEPIRPIAEDPFRLAEDTISQASLNNLNRIYSTSPVPIALDESLEYFLTQPGLPASVRALVIKPTTLGGIYRTVRVLKLCREKNLSGIISSAFDSGFTIRTLALLSQLSAAHGDTPMGLDTYKYLVSDTLQKPLRFSAGRLELLGNE